MKLVSFLFILSAFVFFSCDETNEPAPNTENPSAELRADSEATDSDGNTFRVGFDQVSGNNQNPYVEKLDANGNRLWRQTYETTGVDGRGVLIALDPNGTPWVVFSVDGGSNENTYISKHFVESGAFSGVYMNSYGRGGGSKVAVLTRLNPESGRIEKGTFLAARLTNGNTNTLNITKLGFNDGNVAFEISSAAWPPGTGSSYQRMPDITDEDRIDGAFKLYYEINTALSEILVARLLRE